MGGSISYVSVRDAFIALRKAFPEPAMLSRRCIAVDGTKTKMVGQQIFIWAARDVDSKEVLVIRCIFARSSLDSEFFLKRGSAMLREQAAVSRRKGPWYPEAFTRLGLDYKYESILSMTPWYEEPYQTMVWSPKGQSQTFLQQLLLLLNHAINRKVPGGIHRHL